MDIVLTWWHKMPEQIQIYEANDERSNQTQSASGLGWDFGRRSQKFLVIRALPAMRRASSLRAAAPLGQQVAQHRATLRGFSAPAKDTVANPQLTSTDRSIPHVMRARVQRREKVRTIGQENKRVYDAAVSCCALCDRAPEPTLTPGCRQAQNVSLGVAGRAAAARRRAAAATRADRGLVVPSRNAAAHSVDLRRSRSSGMSGKRRKRRRWPRSRKIGHGRAATLRRARSCGKRRLSD